MAQTAAQKAAAAKAAAAAAAKAKAAAAAKAEKIAADKREAAYIASFNKVTSPSSAGLATSGMRIDSSGFAEVYDPAKEAALGGASGSAPVGSGGSGSGSGGSGGGGGGGNTPVEGLSVEQKDAYALLEAAFRFYDLEELVPIIQGYMKNNVGPNQAKLLLRNEPVYKQRFKGNELRVASGLNALQEDEYLAVENDFMTTLTAYGVPDYFGTGATKADKQARQAKMAEVIGHAVSPDEFKSRVSTVVTRVKNADTATKDAFKAFYNVDEKDLVKYFLGGEGSEALKQKVNAAEIAGARFNAGLGTTTLANVEDLTRLGVDRTAAISGYAQVADVLPTSQKLSGIFSEAGINYNVTSGENEFLRNQATPADERRRLRSLERGAFSAQSGVDENTFGRTNNF